MTGTDAKAYAQVTDFLQQGDIFRQDVVAPMVDTNKRLFRAADGRHGSVVFEEGCPAHVFDEKELLEYLGVCGRTPLHTEPFRTTSDGHPELVIVHAKLASYFIVASQTCDISGQDKDPQLVAIILPIQTIMDICRYQRLPMEHVSQEQITIEDVLTTETETTSLCCEQDAFKYAGLLRQTLSEWRPRTKALEHVRGRVRNYLERLGKAGWMHFLKQDADYQIPESYVDFTAAYTVERKQLEDLMGSRLARIADPYRDQFAQAYANRLSRIAVPTPLRPDKY